ncbi:hypothetical protein SAMN05444141_108103 [Pseudovibrio denitrificans]|uniref:Uncharacterized protein n=1 Tax=Pseudovibrio denitrificans TaxID=258256 RepID=A0A1I7DBA9_9HYPH|nr:hypothetical protein [Pseudovibrio denitrificans]SFU09003.1 hypothetical protein SAMN05444141_108103 [Pseudovibrio denitrificans]
MADEIWVSSVRSNSALFDKPGIREKYYGHDWAPPKFEFGPSPEEFEDSFHRYILGDKLKREEFLEAAYVFNPKFWKRVQDLFALEGYFCAKGEFAEILKRFDMGGGELVEFPIYETDKTTQLPGPFFFINWGSQKHCFLPEESNGVKATARNPETGFHRWRAAIEPQDEDIAVSADALQGADLWIEPLLRSKIFMSGQLHDTIVKAYPKIDFRFSKARIL